MGGIKTHSPNDPCSGPIFGLICLPAGLLYALRSTSHMIS